MPRCPNCSYILVLLEKRGKYKCAKCGKLFLRKEVESKDFREYNKRQKETDKEEFNRQLKLRRKTLKPRIKKYVQPQFKEKIILKTFSLIYSTFYGIFFLIVMSIFIIINGFEDFGLVFGAMIGMYFVFFLVNGLLYIIGTLFVSNQK